MCNPIEKENYLTSQTEFIPSAACSELTKKVEIIALPLKYNIVLKLVYLKALKVKID